MQIKSLAVVAAIAPLATAIGLPKHSGRGWCASEATEDVMASLSALNDAEEQMRIAGNATQLLPRQTPGTIVIPVHMHAVVNTSVSDTFLNKTKMQEQLDVMNKAFAPHDIQFTLESVTRKVENSLARSPFGNMDGAALDAYWKKSHVGGYDTVNLWFYSNFPSRVFGACSLPKDDFPADSYHQDGCHIASGTMPGGEIVDYNLGYTAVHEVGHWLGLLHTFQGLSCKGNGDMISDTPQESRSTQGCPKPYKDSCPENEGTDPIHNYMDYGNDPCYEEFTAGQQTRMHNSWAKYREGKSA
ncbi:hypothetical protein F5Y15DRAFT_421905 [Xylariaceae sp. FL0016]|nr:hypothetical protein F5Y15DRAFT_421905 [Xylariaceae sp. FL0016]